MNCGDVKEYKFEMDGKEYNFRMDFKALAKFQEKYENDALEIYNEWIQGKNQYTNAIKILSCCCIEKDWTDEELEKSLGWSYPLMKVFDGILANMMYGSMVIKDDKENKKGKTKNEKTSQINEEK